MSKNLTRTKFIITKILIAETSILCTAYKLNTLSNTHPEHITHYRLNTLSDTHPEKIDSPLDYCSWQSYNLQVVETTSS